MKRKPFFSMSVLLLILLMTVKFEAQSQKIGFLMDSYIIDRWYKDQDFFVKKIEELGGSCQVEVAHGDPHEQIKLAKKLIDEGVDVLVVVPCDAIKASEIAKMAWEAGIPTVSYDRLIMSRYLSLYVSYNNEKVGELQAEYVIKEVPKGNYILINGPTSDNNAIQFRKGQLKVLQKHIDSGNINILEDYIMSDWNEIEALMKIDEFLSANAAKPDVIIAGNDALANGSLEALKAKGLEGTVAITGQDADLSAIRNIVGGNQSMTIYKPIKTIAHLAAENAMKLARGETLDKLTKMKSGVFEVDAILLDPVVVDKKNYKATVVRDGHIKESDLE